MSYFALFYEVVDNFTEQRTPHRPLHLKSVREAYASGELVMAGALQEPPGALLVFKTEDRGVPERFAKTDPYVTSGLVTKWTVRPWKVVTGHEA